MQLYTPFDTYDDAIHTYRLHIRCPSLFTHLICITQWCAISHLQLHIHKIKIYFVLTFKYWFDASKQHICCVQSKLSVSCKLWMLNWECLKRAEWITQRLFRGTPWRRQNERHSIFFVWHISYLVLVWVWCWDHFGFKISFSY